ncbi:hypothetical protein EV383_6201 [Pseudonocardia sediminis]|uniref:Uncharacterized protein n=1 Tax=Pseudonocardia sediminis TaxID=1397368 RepID=A0A4Q7UBK2_PSEST|nr:hypothetical protein [Pseudonocardia sediminis]RZT75461.1 hypothetical protein EV383_6201 [Pseudonocardia sediminis]
MAKRTAARRIGRPSKGPRVAIGTRIPEAHGTQLRSVASDRGWYHSETAAALISVGLRHLQEATAPAPGTDALMIRVPQTDGQRVRDIAAELDWSYSDTAAALIAVGLRHLDELPAKSSTTPSNPAQQELPLTRAS